MTETHETNAPRKRLLDDLATLRGAARLQAHLLSMDARDRWRKLEEKLDGAEHSLDVGSQAMADAAVEKFAELTRAAKDLFRSESLRAPELSSAVSTVMQAAPVSCGRHESLNRAAQLMWEHGFGALPIVDDDGTVAGMLTDRDVCMGAYTQGKGLASISVESAMSRDAVCADREASLKDVLELMLARRVYRIPVVDDQRQLVGLIALPDVVRAIYRETGSLQVAAPALVQLICRDEFSE